MEKYLYWSGLFRNRSVGTPFMDKVAVNDPFMTSPSTMVEQVFFSKMLKKVFREEPLLEIFP